MGTFVMSLDKYLKMLRLSFPYMYSRHISSLFVIEIIYLCVGVDVSLKTNTLGQFLLFVHFYKAPDCIHIYIR